MADVDQSNLTSLTVDLLSAYVTNNTVEHGALSELIKSTHAALKVIDAPEPPAPEEPEHKPAVSVRKSLSSASHIISLIDGADSDDRAQPFRHDGAQRSEMIAVSGSHPVDT